MIVAAVATIHVANGFVENWYGNQKDGGFEYHLLAIGIAVVLIISNSGKGSLESVIDEKVK